MNKKNMLMVSIIIVCVVILVSLAINAFVSAGGNLENCVSSGSCSGESCSPAERASCGTAESSCGTSSGGCGSSGASGIDYSRLEQEAVSYYAEQTGEVNITAKAYNGTNGIEIAIIKDEKVIDVLKYETESNR